VLLQYYGGQNAHLFRRKVFFSSEFGFAASFWHHATTFMHSWQA
jgi:hypothetical protein